MHDFDAIVVGAGPAGVSAALTMAREGLSVALLERGPYPGSKNLMGGVLYTDVLAELLPDFRERGAPLERYIYKKGLSILSPESETQLGFSTTHWDQTPHNHSWTVLRARFDRWFADQAAEQGVELICGVTVDGTIKDEMGRVIGVSTRMPEGEDAKEGELRAPIVISAEGANSVIAESEAGDDLLGKHGHDLFIRFERHLAGLGAQVLERSAAADTEDSDRHNFSLPCDAGHTAGIIG